MGNTAVILGGHDILIVEPMRDHSQDMCIGEQLATVIVMFLLVN